MSSDAHARQIDKQEFEAASRAALQRALAYSKKCRKQERQLVRAWIKDKKQPVKSSFIFSGRPPATHTINGVTRTFAQWANHLGLTRDGLASRIERFGSLEASVAKGKAVNVGRRPVILEFEGRSLPLSQWAVITGLKPATIHCRLNAGWSVADTLTTCLHGTPGVSSDFMPVEGTGAGSTVQETPNITFSGKVENA
ncbi:hypothetical protein JZX87_10555 [Agrobacterium sp. Ap1]|uniref:hypothetical protein n=1 Tax=Agrobacterium sp. Ap1 TaxID=2815337 RepID=UPI001A8FFC70|nr:hypothetical protein [Agrobacterium sp. Ap1]MBO0141598.1 hypothetical protein [Agrobacterium sp. Ap1]